MIGNLFLALGLACLSASAIRTDNFNKNIEIKNVLQNSTSHSFYYDDDVWALGYLSYNFGSFSDIPIYDRRTPNVNANSYAFYGYDSSNNELNELVSYTSNFANWCSQYEIEFGMIYRLEIHTDSTYHFVYSTFWNYHPYDVYDVSGNLVSSNLANKCEFKFLIVNSQNNPRDVDIYASRSFLNVSRVVSDDLNGDFWNLFGYSDALNFDFSDNYVYYYGSEYRFDLILTSSEFTALSNGSNPFYTSLLQFQYFQYDDIGENYDVILQQGYGRGYQDGLRDGYQNGYAEGIRVGTSANADVKNLFGVIADTPIRFLKQMFNFELFGMNVAVVILSCLTAICMFALIKKIWK